MRQKKRQLKHIGEVFTEKGASAWKKNLKKYALWNKWGEITGSAMMKNTVPLSWINSELVVAVSNHAWIQELQFLRNEILAKIKLAFPELKISGIRFELGRKELFPNTEEKPQKTIIKAPISKDEIKFAKDTTEDIVDPETRKTLRRIIEKDLALKKNRKAT